MYEINNITYSLFNGLPKIISAILLLVLAIIIAYIAKALIIKGGKKLGLTRYVEKWGLSNNKSPESTLETIGKAAFWIVFILFLPGILDTLSLNNVSVPIADMTTKLLSFLPNILGATLVLIVGYVIAKIARDLLALLLRRIRVDELQQKAGLKAGANTTSLSTMLSNIVYVLIWIPIIISALQILNIEAISQPAIYMLNSIMLMIPRIFIAAVLVIIGVYIAKMVASLIANILSGMGINSLYSKLGFNKVITTPKYLLSDIIGNIVSFIIILLFTVEALNVVNLQVLNSVGYAIIAYLPFFISAVIILGAGLLLGTWAEGLLAKYTNASKFTAMVAKCIIVFFAIFMTLNQLGIAMVVVNTAFMMILGALSIAFAVSFGIGGRAFASRTLEKFEQKIENSPKAKNDSTTKKVAENIPDPMEVINPDLRPKNNLD